MESMMVNQDVHEHDDVSTDQRSHAGSQESVKQLPKAPVDKQVRQEPVCLPAQLLHSFGAVEVDETKAGLHFR